LTETFIDTSFVIALVNQKDQYHDQAVKLSAVYDGERLVTTEAVLLEIGNALAKRYRKEAVSVIQTFQASKEVTIIPLSSELFARAFDSYRKFSDKSWGLIDCVSFVVMHERGIVDVLTADNDYRQAGFNRLLGPSS
jgi:predicted nucleic acid-binding protein